MDKLQLKAYGKINLGLDVIRKRPDGYHDLDMIMQMVDVYDDVIIEKKAGEEIVVKVDAAAEPFFLCLLQSTYSRMHQQETETSRIWLSVLMRLYTPKKM